MTPRSKSKLMIVIGSIIVILAFALSACAGQQESNQTYKNRNTINAAIRVPDLSFSTTWFSNASVSTLVHILQDAEHSAKQSSPPLVLQ